MCTPTWNPSEPRRRRRRAFDALNDAMAKVSDCVATHLGLIETYAQTQPTPMLAR